MHQNHEYLRVSGNPVAVSIHDIPMLDYTKFFSQTVHILRNRNCRCVAYFAQPSAGGYIFYMAISDSSSDILLYGHLLKSSEVSLDSLTVQVPALHIYEREIHENYGVAFENHPWLKPVRYPFDRVNKAWMDSYPFYKIDSTELHEVGVGPIHAGVIEPGHFRFICNGEKVLHLEIQLGYQHRGVEALLRADGSILKKMVIAENIAGDSAVSHGLAFAQNVESMAGVEVHPQLAVERTIAQELERVAVHIGDTAALCGDIAYQLGLVVCEALRTITINTSQYWCGNRFSKGLIRPVGTNYPITARVIEEITKNMTKVRKEYLQLTDTLFSLPSVLARFEGIGEVTAEQAYGIGAVGMAARMAGINRDVRISNPYQAYKFFAHEPVVKESGDVMARAELRADEVVQSIDRILEMLQGVDVNAGLPKPYFGLLLKPNTLSLSMVEGWRGEICHVAVTDEGGDIIHYKVKDPSFHNWFALALAVRNQEISDFPICNKSFNLSYCGNDL